MNQSVLSNVEGVLSRIEMKSIIAGDGGNIYCNSGNNNQWSCSGATLMECTDICADLFGTSCNGCAEFPEEHP
jgi:hypothetical protein